MAPSPDAISTGTDAGVPDAGVPDAGAPDAGIPGDAAVAGFTETYEPGSSDVGLWSLTTNTDRSRTIEPGNGNPGGYLYGEVVKSNPTWSTQSPRFQPGIDDGGKTDSVFVGDYGANDISLVSVDLLIAQVGVWTPDRTVTLHLVSWDPANDTVLFDAAYSLPDMPDPPSGWNHYEFRVDARSPTVPPGWMFKHGDDTPGSDADWATFMHKIDQVGFGLWKPDFGYPSLGLWQLGIDNVHVGPLP